MRFACVAGLASILIPFQNAAAQQLSTVWEFLINRPGMPIPVITNAVNYTMDNDNGDGHSLMDSTGPLLRYDAHRLLLGIRENGIDESAANANLFLASQYPDRSLIWIDPSNGAPNGVALTMGLHPVPLDADFVAAGGVPDQYWWTYAVSDDGAIYTGYKNKILRYGPDGRGGISTNVATVFSLSQDDLANHNIDPTLWAGWRWERLHVSGTGKDTVILAGATAVNRGNWRLTTTDGTNFVAGSFLPLGGATSTPIASEDPAAPNTEWVYAGRYPGNSNGADSSYGRYTATPPFTDNYTSDPSYTSPADPFTYSLKYRDDFIGAIEVNPALSYLVVYSTPSWNSRAVFGPDAPRRPGWLALSTHDGRFISSHLIPVTEDDELLSADQTSLFQGTVGYVALNKLADGSIEVLWSGSIYGYGRYLVVPYGPAVRVSAGAKPPGPFPANTVGGVNWIAASGPTYDKTVLIGQEGQGPIPWAISRYHRGSFSVRLSPLDPVGAQENFNILQDYPGAGTGTVAEEQVWRPSADLGVVIPTVRTNGPIDWGDGQGPFYPVVGTSVNGSAGYGYSMIDGSWGAGDGDIQTGKAGDQSASAGFDGNFNFATTWFPYSQGWLGGVVGNPDGKGQAQWYDTNSHSTGLPATIVQWPTTNAVAGGTAVLSLPGINSLNDGMLFTTSAAGESAVRITSSAPQADGSSWVVSVRAASTSDPLVLATNESQFQFVFIPYGASNLIGGLVAASGKAISSRGDFSITRTSVGTYSLAIPGKIGTNGVLLLQNASFLGSATNAADNNFLSYLYQDEGSGTNGVFVIQARHTAAGGTYPLTDINFYFAWIDFAAPLLPPSTAAIGAAPSLTITRTQNGPEISWPASAQGFTLESAGSLPPGVPAVWSPVGVVGQGSLTNGFPIPSAPLAQFYRLRK